MDAPKKVDQLAFYAREPEKAMGMLGLLFGMTEWVTDIAIADGEVFGKPVRAVVGQLWFNYQAGIEVEVLHYATPLHWHSARGPLPDQPMFLSHIGLHVDDMDKARLPYELAGWKVAQELWTTSHTNPYLLERGRTYHYVVFDSRDKIGWDLKLIQRIEKEL